MDGYALTYCDRRYSSPIPWFFESMVVGVAAVGLPDDRIEFSVALEELASGFVEVFGGASGCCWVGNKIMPTPSPSR